MQTSHHLQVSDREAQDLSRALRVIASGISKTRAFSYVMHMKSFESSETALTKGTKHESRAEAQRQRPNILGPVWRWQTRVSKFLLRAKNCWRGMLDQRTCGTSTGCYNVSQKQHLLQKEERDSTTGCQTLHKLQIPSCRNMIRSAGSQPFMHLVKIKPSLLRILNPVSDKLNP